MDVDTENPDELQLTSPMALGPLQPAEDEGEDGEHAEAGEEGMDYSGGTSAIWGAGQGMMLLSDDEDEDGSSKRKPQAKPASKLYRLILRNVAAGLDVEAAVRVFLDYPTRPPLVLVRAVRETSKDRKSQGKEVDAANQIAWMEQEVGDGQ